jgi:hypothetical protein
MKIGDSPQFYVILPHAWTYLFVIASKAWQSHLYVFANEVWQSHQKNH